LSLQREDHKGVNLIIMNRDPDEVPMVTVGAVSKEDLFWLDFMAKIQSESFTVLDDSAKQLIAVIPILQGIYFAAISFSDINFGILNNTVLEGILITLFAIPIVLWLISIRFAMYVLKPEIYEVNMSSPPVIKKFTEKVGLRKYKYLNTAHKVLIAGFAFLPLNIVIYLLLSSMASP